MNNIVYFNGEYHNKSSALVMVEDRGYMFGDGVYEVVAVINRVAIDFDKHLDRLLESLRKIGIFTDEVRLSSDLWIAKDELLRRNGASNVTIYIQITRGVARRHHNFPEFPIQTSVLMLLNPFVVPIFPAKPIECISLPDIRWGRRDIKSIALLGNVLLKQHAKDNGYEEVWLYERDSKIVTECSTRNCFIVGQDGVIYTHPADCYILSGTTRNAVIKLAVAQGYKVMEKKFTIYEVYEAKEAFTTTSGTFVVPVVKLDGNVIGSGLPGQVTQSIEGLYYNYVQEKVGYAVDAKSSVV